MKDKEIKTTAIYLLISYPIKKEDYCSKNEIIIKTNNCKLIYSSKIENDNINQNISIFQYDFTNPKKMTIFLEFFIENANNEKEEYKIKFDYNSKEFKEVCFIYDLNLSYKKEFSNDKSISQNLDYSIKMNHYIKSLIETGQKNKLNNLYNDTIELYSKHPKFQFLINII